MRNAITGEIKSQTGTLIGDLARTQGLTGQLTQEVCLIGNLATAYTSASVKYEGEYEVIPTVEGLELETRDKYMTDDVKIRAIPFYEVSNQSGGNTVYIAGDLEME